MYQISFCCYFGFGYCIVGTVKHHVCQYEVQHRGSLHAHIILWLDPADVDCVAAETSAYVLLPGMQLLQLSCRLKSELNTLFQYVTKKQMHFCREQHCLENSPTCSFPHRRTDHLSIQLPSANGHRPQHCDRKVVPYYPVVLLLWGAHMNPLRIHHKLSCLVILCPEVSHESRANWSPHL